MAEKTITAFLTERDLNPVDFAAVVTHFGNQRGREESEEKIRSASGYFRGWHIRDIKRFGDTIVVLEGFKSWGYTPGIRRSTFTTVFAADGSIFSSGEINYIDGGYQTYHLDDQSRDFYEIVSADQEASRFSVRLRNPHRPYEQDVGVRSLIGRWLTSGAG